VKDEDTDIDEEKGVMMYAQNFAVKINDVPAADFVALSGAKAWYIVNGEAIPTVRLRGEKPTTKADHEVTFEAVVDDKPVAEKTVIAYIYDDIGEEVPGDESKQVIRANDFTVDLKELADMDEAAYQRNAIGWARVEVYDITNLPPTRLDANTVKVIGDLPLVAGQTTVTFVSPNEKAQQTVNVTVTNNEPSEPFEFTAEKMVAYTKGAKVDEATFFKDANVNGNKPYRATSNFADRVKLDTVGDYQVTITGIDTETNEMKSVTTVVQVRDKDTEGEGDGTAMMSAHDFALKIEDVATADFISLAEAKAWVEATNEPIPTIQVQTPKPTTVGSYNVTFAALNKDGKVLVTKTVFAHIYNDLGEGENGKNIQAIRANNFTVELSQINAETYATDVLTWAQVELYDITTLPPVVMDVNSVTVLGDVPAGIGETTVTFVTPNGGAQVTVEVNVVDNSVFEFSAEQMVEYMKDTQVDEARFFKDANVSANKPYTATSNFEATVKLDTVGVYPVTITGKDTATDAEKQVVTVVLVRDEDTSIDENHKAMMSAHGFVIKLSEVQAADFVLLAEAKAWDMTTGLALPTVRMKSEKPTVAGKHTVTFEALNAAEVIVVQKDVEVEVVDDSGMSENDVVLEADNVTFTVGEVNTFKDNGKLETEVLKRAKAKAYVQQSKEELTPLTADVNEILTAEIVGGEVFNVVIAYDGASVFAGGTTQRHQKVIDLTIDKEDLAKPVDPKEPTDVVDQTKPKRPIPGLPLTGENITLLVVGLITFISSLGILLALVVYRRRRNKTYKLTDDE